MSDEDIIIGDVNAPEPEPEAPEPEPEAPGPEVVAEEHEGEERVKKPGSQKQKERAQRAEAENQRLRAEVEEIKARMAPPAQPQYQAEPDPNDPKYETLEHYYRDLADYRAEMKIQGLKLEMQAQQAQEMARKADAEWRARCAKAAETKPDWDEAIEEFNWHGREISRVNPAVVQAAGSAIAESEIGPELVHYLGTHPDELQAFGSMSPMAAVRMIGRLEAQLSGNKPNKGTNQTKAPAPLAPVKAGTAPKRDDSDGIRFF